MSIQQLDFEKAYQQTKRQLDEVVQELIVTKHELAKSRQDARLLARGIEKLKARLEECRQLALKKGV